MKKTELYEEIENKKVKCSACQHNCVIAPDNVGFCQTRLNKKGQLYSLIYGKLSAAQVDPVEKKPLYHFHPGEKVLSIGSYGCNYHCKQCLNYHCSWGPAAEEILQRLKEKETRKKRGNSYTPPEKIVESALKRDIPGITFTYNEPSIWPEYVYDVAKLAKEEGLFTVYVTNGSWTKESLTLLAEVIDACNIDIKGFWPKTYQRMGGFFGQVLEMTKAAVSKYKIFTELTTLVIPTINDSQEELKKIAEWIVNHLGPEIPWHLSRFDPDLAPDKEFKELAATPIESLKRAYDIGQAAGLKYVYVWAPPKKWDEGLFAVGDTFCPECGKKVVERPRGWQPELVGVKKEKGQTCCLFCGKEINLVV